MNWLLLTFISVLFRAVYGLMTKVLSSRMNVSVYSQSTLLPFFAAILSLILSPLLGGISFVGTKESFLLLFLIVVSSGLGNLTYFVAIKNLTSGMAQISFSSILVFNTLLSLLFLNLHLSLVNVLGIFILLTALILVNTGKVEFHAKGVALMTLSALLFSIFQLSTSRMSSIVSAATYLVLAYSGTVLVIFLFKAKDIIQDIRSSTDKKSLFLIPFLTALPSLGNFVFSYFAYRVAPEPAKVAMLLTSQVVFAVILSYIFLKERTQLPRKLVAAVLVVVAAVLIKS